jgi:hypothetical protein
MRVQRKSRQTPVITPPKGKACSDDMRTCFPLLMRPRFDVNVTGKEDESIKRRKDGERGKGQYDAGNSVLDSGGEGALNEA